LTGWGFPSTLNQGLTVAFKGHDPDP